MIDHLLFNNQKFIPETQEVKTKLADYDQLKAFHDRAINSKAYSDNSGGYQYLAYCDADGTVKWKNANEPLLHD